MEVCCQRNQCDNKASSRALDLIQVFFFLSPSPVTPCIKVPHDFDLFEDTW